MLKSPGRNQKSKGVRAKDVVQICFLLAICYWLIYQVKHSYDKKKIFDVIDIKQTASPLPTGDVLKLGRKDPISKEEKPGSNYGKSYEDTQETEETEDEETIGDEEGINKNEQVAPAVDGDDGKDEHELEKSDEEVDGQEMKDEEEKGGKENNEKDDEDSSDKNSLKYEDIVRPQTTDNVLKLGRKNPISEEEKLESNNGKSHEEADDEKTTEDEEENKNEKVAEAEDGDDDGWGDGVDGKDEHEVEKSYEDVDGEEEKDEEVKSGKENNDKDDEDSVEKYQDIEDDETDAKQTVNVLKLGRKYPILKEEKPETKNGKSHEEKEDEKTIGDEEENTNEQVVAQEEAVEEEVTEKSDEVGREEVTYEATEDYYKADDASSSVTPTSQTMASDNKRVENLKELAGKDSLGDETSASSVQGQEIAETEGDTNENDAVEKFADNFIQSSDRNNVATKTTTTDVNAVTMNDVTLITEIVDEVHDDPIDLSDYSISLEETNEDQDLEILANVVNEDGNDEIAAE